MVTNTNWTTCKSPFIGVVVAFALSIGFCVAAGIVLPLVNAPIWVMSLFAILATLAIGSAIVVARARVRYNDYEIESRYFRHIRRKWDDAKGWSRLGENGTLFIGFKDGTVIGSDGSALSDDDVDQLIEVLRRKLGDPRTGDDTIMPWYVALVVGSLVRQ